MKAFIQTANQEAETAVERYQIDAAFLHGLIVLTVETISSLLNAVFNESSGG